MRFLIVPSWACTTKHYRICNLRQMAIFCSKLVSFLLVVTNTLAWTNILPCTNKLAYYGIRKLRVRSVFIVQAPGLWWVNAAQEMNENSRCFQFWEMAGGGQLKLIFWRQAFYWLKINLGDLGCLSSYLSIVFSQYQA